MTREERIAAGWRECWGVRMGEGDKACWYVAGVWIGPKAKGRKDFGNAYAAMHFITFDTERRIGERNAVGAEPLTSANLSAVTPRRFWRRSKPKTAPPLKVGAEIAIRAVVKQVDSSSTFSTFVQVGACGFWIDPTTAVVR